MCWYNIVDNLLLLLRQLRKENKRLLLLKVEEQKLQFKIIENIQVKQAKGVLDTLRKKL